MTWAWPPQANNGVLAAAYATGGSEKNLKPALELFGQLAKAGSPVAKRPDHRQHREGRGGSGVLWDFNALNYRDQIDPRKFDVVIPSDGSVIAGYTTIINKWARTPTPPNWPVNTSLRCRSNQPGPWLRPPHPQQRDSAG